MGKSKKLTRNNKKKKRSQTIKEQIKCSENKKLLLEKRCEEREAKIRNFESISHALCEYILNILRVMGFLIFLLSLIAIALFIVWCIFLYMRGDNIFANIVLTVMQVLTGMVSLGVGIWALILTIKSSRTKTNTHQKLQIYTSSVSSKNIQGKPETDVDSSSLD